eukprot:2529617-Pyramimonas_sp.AAC.1
MIWPGRRSTFPGPGRPGHRLTRSLASRGNDNFFCKVTIGRPEQLCFCYAAGFGLLSGSVWGRGA